MLLNFFYLINYNLQYLRKIKFHFIKIIFSKKYTILNVFVFLGVAPMTAFLPTIAKQLGYSTFIFGVVYSILPIFSLIIKPVVGAIVDQFQVKKTIFLTFILLTGLSTFALMFVPEIPLETVAELHCHEVTYLNVCSNNTLSTSECDVQRVMKHKIEDLVNCEVNHCIFLCV